MEQKMKDELEKLASRDCWCDEDEFFVDDFAGGNFDDAYQGGFSDGQSLLARKLLKLLFNKEHIKKS